MIKWTLTNTNLEQVKQELINRKYGRGIIAQVYCGMVSIYYNTAEYSGYLELNMVGSVNTSTTIRNEAEDALNRIGEDGYECEYYWFETLNEFCEYSLKEGWR